MSASDALAAIQTIYSIACKVKDNKDELLRVSQRIQYIVESLEDSRNRDVIRLDEYNDALTVVSELITRVQRVTRRLLKRSLGDRTWNASEITEDIRRLNEDVQSFLSVHTIKTLDIIHTSHTEKYSTLSNNMEEIMVKIAELDLYLRSPPGDSWTPHINLKARNNFSKKETGQGNAEQAMIPLRMHLASPTAETVHSPEGKLPSKGASRSAAYEVNHTPSKPIITTTDDGRLRVSSPLLLQSLASGNRKTFHITDLEMNPGYKGWRITEVNLDEKHSALDLSGLTLDTTIQQLATAISDQGYRVPGKLCEERALHITVVDGDSVYDATAPGGLQISATEPLLWWWNKYTDYHGLSPTTTPLQSVIQCNHQSQGSFVVAGVNFLFHRTLRVPDTGVNNLPPNLGSFPLVAVPQYARRLPDNINQRGGFLMPMFRREALWISFHSASPAAVKVSVGGVNAVSGVAKDEMVPPGADIKQDYIVAGCQPWLDGIVTGPGVVRQFVVTELGQGYTVEEQVTGKAEIGGFQFDVFPRRATVQGDFILPVHGRPNFAGYDDYGPTTQEKLNPVKTPNELGVESGNRLVLLRLKSSCEIMLSNGLSPPRLSLSVIWTLSNYLRRVSPSASLKAIYPAPPSRANGLSYASSLGVAAGGEIKQKIYRDTDCVRVYDQERSHRVYVHIVTPEAWEDITGILPPFTPITEEMYHKSNIPWFKLYDDYVAGILTTSETLSQVVSVAEMDKRKQEAIASNNVINPDAPPRCSIHPSSTSACVFRPCGHVACTKCLGDALMRGSKCHCKVPVSKFVGMKQPLPMVSSSDEAEDKNPEGESSWTVHEMEELSTAAAQSGFITVLHLPQDRVSSLYSAPLDRL